ncbi:MAG: hemerythrin family protein [Geothrix sp.]|uniref:bacteriohemerythrin n=1 Tax=Geothrix sp. TaxID=1962974 RepID=UPI0017A5B36C|nr:hemerythrin family protein [Geothrix sp.]NWJ39940.1 hemerythrin family protein [Geothrix sp.]WIL22048.1 MAG: hemerythrin family protein [Geothrix sp.]
MSMVIWNPAWETGIPLIDQQHQALLAQFEALLVAIHENHPDDRIPPLLQFLADYVETHFALEEGLMQVADYPGFAGHKAIHDRMRARVGQLVEAARGNPATLTEEVIDFLTDWLLRHINEEDRRMAQHVHHAGGTQARPESGIVP